MPQRLTKSSIYSRSLGLAACASLESKNEVCLLCEVNPKQIPAFDFICASLESILAIEDTWEREEGASERGELGDKDTKEDKEDKSLDMNDKRERSEEEGHGLKEREEEVVPKGLCQSKREQIGYLRLDRPYLPHGYRWHRLYCIPVYVPLVAPVQTSPYPKLSYGSLPVSPSSLVVPSPIASPVTTPAATVSVDEDQFLEVGAQLELHGSILHDHTQRLEALPPTLFEGYERDLRELYTRSGAVRDEIFSQRYRFRSLEREQERVMVTFSAIWRPILALEA
ncbi:hypothetical protein Tco_0129023 [Tanacetum coccineum]